MCCAIPRTGCRMQSWTQPVDCTTFETRTQSGGSKPNENLIPDKVYFMVPNQLRLRPDAMILSQSSLYVISPKSPWSLAAIVWSPANPCPKTKRVSPKDRSARGEPVSLAYTNLIVSVFA